MNKIIPRKIKKSCKNATLFYNKECTLMCIQFKYKQNTKWKRKAVSFIKREEKLKLKYMERDVHNLFMEKFKEYEQSK